MAMRFEWDPAKDALNRAKHRIAFETAIAAFNDTRAVVAIDDREDYAEERLVRIAMVGARYLFVCYTERIDAAGNEVIRIISARKATAHERRTYHEG